MQCQLYTQHIAELAAEHLSHIDINSIPDKAYAMLQLNWLCDNVQDIIYKTCWTSDCKLTTDRNSGTTFGPLFVAQGLANCSLALKMQINHTMMSAVMELTVRYKQSISK